MLQAELDPARYTGRSEAQVGEFLKEYLLPLLERARPLAADTRGSARHDLVAEMKVEAVGLQKYIEQQLNPAAVDDVVFGLLEPEAGVLRAGDGVRALVRRARAGGLQLVRAPAGALDQLVERAELDRVGRAGLRAGRLPGRGPLPAGLRADRGAGRCH